MNGNRRDFLKAAAGATVAGALSNAANSSAKPNIDWIMADDLGYGDLSCLNESSKIQTPNLDRLANEGMTFTDAHAPSAVCTPTRYGVMTGRYCFRSALKNGVLGGGSPPFIAPDRRASIFHESTLTQMHLTGRPSQRGSRITWNRNSAPMSANGT